MAIDLQKQTDSVSAYKLPRARRKLEVLNFPARSPRVSWACFSARVRHWFVFLLSRARHWCHDFAFLALATVVVLWLFFSAGL